MAMKRSDSSFWAGLFFWLLIGVWVHGGFFESVPSVLFWAAYVIVIAAGFCAFFLLAKFVGTLQDRRRQREEASRICKHGIEGGETRDRCASCKADRIQQEKEYEIQRARKERLKQLESAAATLRTEEHVRLTKARLHRIDFLLNLSPSQFEDAIAVMYQQLGYTVKQTAISNDFGRDAILLKDGKKYLVECKRYGADMLIGRPALQKFYAAIIGDKADGGFFITTSSFARTAIKYAKETQITCIDGKALSVLMQQAYPSENESLYSMLCCECGEKVTFDLSKLEQEKFCTNNHRISNDLDLGLMSPSLVQGIPVCPKCGRKMRLISGYRGKFWGCSGYPKCRLTKSYRVVEQSAPMNSPDGGALTTP